MGILDTNLQQCHDFAHLRTLIENSGPAEKERIYNSLKSEAMEAVENILHKATSLLDSPIAGSLGDDHSSAHSVSELVNSDSSLQLMGVASAELDELA